MAASQKKVAAYLKKGWNYYQILNPSIITWQIYIKSRLKISSRTAQPFKGSFEKKRLQSFASRLHKAQEFTKIWSYLWNFLPDQL